MTQLPVNVNAITDACNNVKKLQSNCIRMQIVDTKH